MAGNSSNSLRDEVTSNLSVIDLQNSLLLSDRMASPRLKGTYIINLW